MIVFIGSKVKGFFVEEIAEQKGMQAVFIESSHDIRNQINMILEVQGPKFMIFDVEQYTNDAETLANELQRIRKVNNAKIIIFAEGYLPNSTMIISLLKNEFKNFIFATSLGKKKDQLEKCMNGYYDANGMEELKDIELLEEKEEIEQIKKDRGFRSIAVAGTMSRIGTTTQALQIVKFLMFNGYKAAYIQMNSTGYAQNLAEYYETECNDELGKVTYENTDLFYKPEKISELLKMDYDFYVYDFGVFEDTDYSKVSFLEKDIKIVVCGVKANEIIKTTAIIDNVFYADVNYIFSFVPDGDKADVYELMDEKKEKSFFSGYVPNPFQFCNSDIYSKFIEIEDRSENKRKKKIPIFGRRRKK